ncbi:MAG TPA: rod shape-determining protein MreC, partial [Proteobacteria bacterium]|nr:rod shape-determining protein MreC [Pseudomonadota bacterium]
SRITLITDPLCGVDAFVARSLERGIVRGYERDALIMRYLPETADIKRGDLVLTSGKGFIFPKGIPVGRVVSLTTDPRTHETIAVLQPSAHINRLFEVLIVLGGEGL